MGMRLLVISRRVSILQNVPVPTSKVYSVNNHSLNEIMEVISID